MKSCLDLRLNLQLFLHDLVGGNSLCSLWPLFLIASLNNLFISCSLLSLRAGILFTASASLCKSPGNTIWKYNPGPQINTVEAPCRILGIRSEHKISTNCQVKLCTLFLKVWKGILGIQDFTKKWCRIQEAGFAKIRHRCRIVKRNWDVGFS